MNRTVGEPSDHKVDVPQQYDKETEPQSEGRKMVFPRWLWTGMLSVEVFIYGSYSILVTLSKEDGKILYSSSHLVLLIEGLKLLISFLMYFPEFYKNGFRFPATSYTTVLCFAIPAVLYSINNNLALHMLLYMDPTTFEVLNKLKIVTTALLYKWIIKRKITAVQWIALGLLILAGLFDSYGGFHDNHADPTLTSMFITTQGLLMMAVYCTLSGLAAVYTEYILKKNITESLHYQNIMLYSFGIMINGGASLWQLQKKNSLLPMGLFTGFNVYTWLIVLTQAFNGLILAVVFKHGSNITRLFIISSAVIASTLMSIFILGTVINTYFIVAALLVSLALYLYHL